MGHLLLFCRSVMKSYFCLFFHQNFVFIEVEFSSFQSCSFLFSDIAPISGLPEIFSSPGWKIRSRMPGQGDSQSEKWKLFQLISQNYFFVLQVVENKCQGKQVCLLVVNRENLSPGELKEQTRCLGSRLVESWHRKLKHHWVEQLLSPQWSVKRNNGL